MSREGKPITILVADDDADDRMLIEDAFDESCLQNPLHFVEDGEQLLRYLRREGDFAKLEGEPFPGVILLDLNMPKMDGRTALGKIKEEVSSFITKPVTFDRLVEVVKTIGAYWIEIVALPPECTTQAA